jgi:hypothetical protein
VWGLENGYGLMVGGDAEHVERAMPIFDALRPEGPREEGFAHAGRIGAGHFAKMVHNGIEYGLMQAYAEGFELLEASELVDDVPATIKAWQRGTVVRSWLLDLLVRALESDPELDDLRGHVEDSGEGRWTVEEAIKHAVPAPVISAATPCRPRVLRPVPARPRADELYVRHLQVTDFRSWEHADLVFEPGVSVLVGRNGQGKTNLVEALGYVATLGSHRVATDAPLIRHGASRAVVRAAVVNEGRELLVELEITPGKANRARVNRGPVPRPRDVLGILRTVLFAPEDLALVRGDPGERRRFLDELLTTRAPRYAGVRSDYERVLKQRGALLKTVRAARGRGVRGGGAGVPARADRVPVEPRRGVPGVARPGRAGGRAARRAAPGAPAGGRAGRVPGRAAPRRPRPGARRPAREGLRQSR